MLLEPPGTPERVIVFLPGFMGSPESYRELLAPAVAHGAVAVVPRLYRRGPAALLGRVTVAAEAEGAAEVVRSVAAEHPGLPVILGGHSRGGQAAWRAASLLARGLPADGSGRRSGLPADGSGRWSGLPADGSGRWSGLPADGSGRWSGLPAALILVDPVDGEGRSPSGPTSTRDAPPPACPTLIIGAGIGGRCAPDPVNHRVFAAATPACTHLVVRELGHADLLSGRGRDLGRRLCPGAPDPDPGRATCADLVDRFARAPADAAQLDGPLVERAG